MNKLLAMLLTLGSFSSFACIDYESTSEICVDDTVFKGSEYKNGAKVVAINSYENTITVRSVNNSKLFVERARDLDLTKGCLLGVCVDDTVFKGSEYKYGAKVVAINSHENTITVKSVNNSKLFVERARDLDVVDACVDYGTAERSMHNFPND